MLTLSSTVSTLQLVCMSFKRTFGDVDWEAMAALQEIDIQSDKLKFGDNMSSLVKLATLRCIKFLDCMPAKCIPKPPCGLEPLFYGLARHRPDVTLFVDGNRMETL